MPPDNPSISVVVPTYRRERPLCDTLRVLLTQRSPIIEVIVVDQTLAHSSDTNDYLATVAGDLRLLRLEHPGLPAARNAGVAAARGEIVLFLDDDIYPGPDLALRHLRHYVDATVGGVAGRVHVAAAPDPRGYPWPDGPDIFDRSDHEDRPFARGCNMSFRRELIVQAGLFDVLYAGNAVGEEEDLAFGIRRLGRRILFDPEAWIIHLLEASGGCRVEHADARQTTTFCRNKVYFALKNVAGPDFCRVLWDTYRSSAWRGPGRLAGQWRFLMGLWYGWRTYRRAGWRVKRLPYVWARGGKTLVTELR